MIDFSQTSAYYMPNGDEGICYVLAREGDLIKIQDVYSGEILFARPEWIAG